MQTIATIADSIGNLTLLEASQLVKQLEAKLGVSAVQVSAVPVPANLPVEAVEVKTEFDLQLKEVGGNKIAVIKEVRAAIPNLGLAEAKKIVDSIPCSLGIRVTKDEIDSIKAKLETAGAKVEVI